MIDREHDLPITKRALRPINRIAFRSCRLANGDFA
jgi:hypothetical protein